MADCSIIFENFRFLQLMPILWYKQVQCYCLMTRNYKNGENNKCTCQHKTFDAKP